MPTSPATAKTHCHMRRVTAEEIVRLLGSQIQEVRGDAGASAETPVSIDAVVDGGGVSFVSGSAAADRASLECTSATIVFCRRTLAERVRSEALDRLTLLITENPRLAFLRLLRERFSASLPVGTHPTAIISSDAVIAADAYIGPYVVVGSSEVSSGCVIHARAVLYDHVRLGRNVVVHSGAVLGADGFGYERNEAGVFERFPHLGGVVVGDDVEIGANACVDRGTLEDTTIGPGTKIDDLVYVAHNVTIGRNCILVAGTNVCGSAVIGDGVWLGPDTAVRDKVTVGSGATVGVAAAVVRNVQPDTVVAGVPARPL